MTPEQFILLLIKAVVAVFLMFLLFIMAFQLLIIAIQIASAPVWLIYKGIKLLKHKNR